MKLLGSLACGRPPKAWMKFLVLTEAAFRKSCVGTKNGLVLELRMRCPSTELKKKVLSFMAGPPNDPPNWLRTKLLFSKPLALSSNGPPRAPRRDRTRMRCREDWRFPTW